MGSTGDSAGTWNGLKRSAEADDDMLSDSEMKKKVLVDLTFYTRFCRK